MADKAPAATERVPESSPPATAPPAAVAEDSDPDFDDLDGS